MAAWFASRVAAVPLWVCLLALSWDCRSLAQDAKVRATMPNPSAWVGERVPLVVELLVPGIFAGAASFDFSDPPGLMLFPPAEHPRVSSETISGVSYSVQQHELSAFAQRAGEQTIPSFTVKFAFKRHPLDQETVAASLRTEPLKFMANLPPGAEKLGGLISARDLKITETWQPEPGKTHVKAGDAFTRTITFTAAGTPGMLFPPFPAGTMDGLGIYPKPPEVLDRSNRGDLAGERRDAITYVCERAGRFTIPAARLVWFDLDSKELRTNELPARTLEVAPNPSLASTASTSDSSAAAATKPVPDGPRNRGRLWSGAGLVVFAALLAWRTRRFSRFWQPVMAVFRPVHLQPLNPSSRLPPARRA